MTRQMHAIILDIDGTLLESDRVDGELYIRAIHRVIGPANIRKNWAAYKHVTDTGILHEVMKDNGVPKSIRTIEAIKRVFVESLACHVTKSGAFPEIPGAKDFVASLNSAQDRAFAYATGGWEESALLKLRTAGFPIQGVPLSSSDDSFDRREIMAHALDKLGNDFESITYYGDGEWDRQAANDLGWTFVPVGIELGGITRYAQTGA